MKISFRSFFEGMLLVALLIFFLVLFYGFFPYKEHMYRLFDLHWLVPLLVSMFLFDKMLLFFHLFRREARHARLSCDPEKLTILIACWNGEDVIAETIEQALTQVPRKHIVVVSDASTDRTAEIARSYGVRVYENEHNLWKAMTINWAIQHVTTPYVLILDDDTRVKGMMIPTSLLDEGYAAVSFNLLPLQKGKLIFDLQRFEYRRSMVFSRSLRGLVGGVANVSGAIGLFRTKDLKFQATRHSGQWGGEDQQRTAYVHLYSEGKGVTFVPEEVRTLAPPTWKKLFRQRTVFWNRAVHENFWLFFKMLWHVHVPFILKLDRFYVLFYFLTEPIRLFGWLASLLLFTPATLLLFLISYPLSLFWEFLVYFKTRRKDPLYVIFVYPFYSMFKMVTRYIAYFMWFRWKYIYIFQKRHHVRLPDRNLLLEYVTISLIIFSMMSLAYFASRQW